MMLLSPGPVAAGLPAPFAMNDISKPQKWHTFGEPAAKALTTATNTPGVVYAMDPHALPQQLQKMTGVASYYVSGYVTPQVLSNGLSVCGEMLVARVDGTTTKNYSYVFGVNSAGIVQFAGPFTGFGHHITSGQSVQVNSLFGNTPFSTAHAP